MVFAEVAAGDPTRAAFAFFGTTTAGSNYDQPDFPGVWYSLHLDHLRRRPDLDDGQRHA